MIRERHRLRDRGVTCPFRDQPVHPLADPPVRRVSLRGRSELDDVHRFPRVHPHVEADAVGHRDGVLRHGRRAPARKTVVQRGGVVHHAAPVGRRAGFRAGVGQGRVSVPRRQILPVDGQHPVALQVPERAVVGHDVERVGRMLEGPAGAVPAVLPLPGAGPEHPDPLFGRHAARHGQQTVERERGGGVEGRGHHLDLAFGVEVGQRDLGARPGVRGTGRRLGERPRLPFARREIAAPADAAVRSIDPLQERGNHPSELLEQQAGHLARFGQRMGPHAQQQHLAGLAGAVDSHVGPGCGRQEAAQRVERLGADHRAVDRVRIRGGPRVPRAEVLLQRPDPARVGLERPIERRLERPAVRVVLQLGRDDVLPASAGPVGVRHVAGRLLQVRHQPAALEHLREDVRHALAGDVRAAELRHRVVAVLLEHPAVQPLGAFAARLAAGAGRVPAGAVEEFVEEEAPQRLRGARIPREERPLDRLGKVGQREDRPVRVAEAGRQRGGFLRGEGLRDGERRTHAVMIRRGYGGPAPHPVR